MTRSLPVRLFLALLILLIAGAAWAALAPLASSSRDRLFEIPRGTYARHMAGDHVDILPQTIDLTLDVQDTLVLKNNDVTPHIFGPTLVMPGQTFSLPFTQASTYSFQCTAHANGQLNIIVAPEPTLGWPRLRWCAQKLLSAA